ncbi:hypothetical protein VTP01DRAFT_4397 [Rhizomucor pusillus]|uniref:uncharacterized protein n=1 Tax=Rhizomucor pusillus TaxID=4840 RepID=UPI0037421DD8
METLTADGNVTKRVIRQGKGVKPAKDNYEVCIHYDSYLVEQEYKFDSSRDRNVPFTFKLKDGKVIQALEIAIPTMQIGEIAEITCTYDYGYGAQGRHPIVPPKAKLRLEVELLGTWDPAPAITASQRLQLAEEEKKKGNHLFKNGYIESALMTYRKAREYIIDLWDCEPEETLRCRELVIALHSNISACYLKLRQWDYAIEASKKALDRDPTNAKACYRIGQACLENGDYDQGLEFIRHGLQISPEDADLKSMQANLIRKQKDYLKGSKELYGRMFGKTSSQS